MTERIVIKNIDVISMTGSETSRNDVIIRNGRIEHVGSGGPQEESEVIDGSGKYLIPGLFDMHVHLETEDHFPLFLMNGVTGIRDMGNTRDDIFLLRNKVNQGKKTGPYMSVCGPILEGDPPLWSGFKVVSSKATAKRAVEDIASNGADFIKVYHTLKQPEYVAILETAKEAGLYVTGHVPYALDAKQALQAGQSGLEHMSDVVEYVGDLKMRDAQDDEEPGYQVFTDLKIQPDKLDELTKILSSQEHTFICPTLVLDEQIGQLQDYENLKQQKEAQYLPDHYRETDWNPQHSNSSANINGLKPLFFKNLQLLHEKGRVIVPELAKNTAILAGSDTPNPFVVPGFSLLRELELMVKTGLNPYQALQSATYNAASVLNKLDEFGTVTPSKRANLVMLDANPLEDITNIRRIHATILNGVYMPYKELEKKARKIKQPS